MKNANRWTVVRARGPFGALGAGLPLLLLTGTLSAEPTPTDAPPPVPTDETATPSPDAVRVERPQLLPGAFSPLEKSADVMVTALFRLMPGRRHLPSHLQKREHDDYPAVFRWMPRSWTSFGWGRPQLLVGNQNTWYEGAPKPVGEKGTFQISRYPDLPPPLCWLPLYFAVTTPNGIHLRLGARWDDVDAYVQFPSIAWKLDVKE